MLKKNKMLFLAYDIAKYLKELIVKEDIRQQVFLRENTLILSVSFWGSK